MSFERARAIADAVLLEGYVLYPYRASALKNRYRYTFGVLAPRAWSEAGGGEPWWLESQCLIEGSVDTKLTGRLRFLAVDRKDDGWDEGRTKEIDFLRMLGWPLDCDRRAITFEDAGSSTVGRIEIAAEIVSTEPSLIKLEIRVENLTPWPDLGAPRQDMLVGAFAGTHLLLEVEPPAEFISLVDPPDWAVDAARGCRSVGTHPVLIGGSVKSRTVLSAPIILSDDAQIAPESPGDFYDASEIDELLVLRTMTLTDDEKREARATDARAAAIVDRVEKIDPEGFLRLHGAIRDQRPATAFRRGCRVRLRPGTRRTDAQDLLYAGQIATVEKVLVDVDGKEHLAVTIDADPAADLHRWYGRYHYYAVDEVDLVAEDP